jgi:hypothetical protein
LLEIRLLRQVIRLAIPIGVVVSDVRILVQARRVLRLVRDELTRVVVGDAVVVTPLMRSYAVAAAENVGLAADGAGGFGHGRFPYKVDRAIGVIYQLCLSPSIAVAEKSEIIVAHYNERSAFPPEGEFVVLTLEH